MDKKAEALDVAIRKEKDGRIVKRLIAVNAIKSDGMSVNNVARLVRVNTCSVHGWMKWYEKYGVEGLYDAEIPGAKPKVEYEKIYEKMVMLAEINMLYPKKLREAIYNSTGVLYSLCQIRRIMKKLSYSPKVAAATFTNKASKRTIKA